MILRHTAAGSDRASLGAISMSALGQKATFQSGDAMSAPPPKADIAERY